MAATMDGTRPSASTNVRAFGGRMAGRSLPAAERDPERLRRTRPRSRGVRHSGGLTLSTLFPSPVGWQDDAQLDALLERGWGRGHRDRGVRASARDAAAATA